MKEVLVYVDDEPLLRQVLEVLAERDDLVIRRPECVAALLDQVGATSVVLTDLLLDGPASAGGMLDRVRRDKKGASVPIVVLTSAANESLAVQALRESATSYVPVRLIATELIDTLETVFSLAIARRDRSRVMQYMRHWHSEFEIENDRTLIAPLVRFIQDTLTQLTFLRAGTEEMRLGIALEESLLNAMYHGNLEVPSTLRESDDSEFYDVIESRSKTSPYCDRRIRLQVSLEPSEVAFVVTDEGPGFDVSMVPDPTTAGNVERLCGRGMLLMRTFMDEVHYNARGNEVRLVKRKSLSA